MIRKLLTALVDSARSVIERIEYGPRVPDPFRRVEVDRPDHGRTFLYRSHTACCDSPSWVPTGSVKSRVVTPLNGAARSLAFAYAFSDLGGDVKDVERMRAMIKRVEAA